jgi:hypothetical protein
MKPIAEIKNSIRGKNRNFLSKKNLLNKMYFLREQE